MKIFSLKCPECGASLIPPNNRNFGYCHYCGTKYYLEDGVVRVEINHNINKTANPEYARASEAEAEAKKAEEETKQTKLIVIMGIVMLTLLFGLMFFLTLKDSSKQENASTIESITVLVTTHHSSKEYIDEDYNLVEKELKKRGFTNITVTVEKSSEKLGTVSSVTINGKSFESGDAFPEDAEVVIKYRAEKLFH